MRRRLLYAESPAMAALIEQADRLMDSPAFRVVKAEGKTRAGFFASADAPTVFIKRTEARSRLAGLYDAAAGSRASRALRGAKILREAGFLCATPFGAMDLILSRAVHASYLISEALESAQILSHFALGREGEARKGYVHRKAVSNALASELRRMHDAGIYTRDLQETNIMVEEREGTFAFYFLDLEDFRRASSVSRHRRMLNLVHLDRSIGRFVSRAGRLDFLYAYLGRQLDRHARRKAVAEYLQLRRTVERARTRRRA
jgi:tRNA A-37 threonylcarbamoyl transferase component Bud32